MKVTVITMYRARDAEMFTQVVEGELTDEQKEEWRKAHKCDEHDPDPEDDGDTPNNMFFERGNSQLAECRWRLANMCSG